MIMVDDGDNDDGKMIVVIMVDKCDNGDYVEDKGNRGNGDNSN